MITIGKLVGNSLVLPFFTSTIPAGFPSPAQDYQEEEINLCKVLQPNADSTFVIRIIGNSMEDANIPDGCLAVVDRSIRPVSGAIVLAVLDGEFTVKRFVKAGRNLVLHPENKLYKPILITEEMNFQVWGVITYTIVDQKP